jgi:20S proteasome subunit alpha 7
VQTCTLYNYLFYFILKLIIINLFSIFHSTVIGLKGKDVVIFAVEKLITSKLYEPCTNKRTFNIDQHIGMAISGLISDARQIVETARLEAANYRAQYGIGIPLKYLNDRISMYMHAYTLYSAVRPYGCSIILSAYQNNNAEMYMIDPSGVSYGYYGCAIGKIQLYSLYKVYLLTIIIIFIFF